MKHSPSLIGADVQVYKSEYRTSSQPRAGKIIGFHPDDGLFEVLVITSYSLDQRNGLPGLVTLPRCLVIDDPNEIPVGVSEYAIVRGNVDNHRVPSLTTDILAKTASSPKSTTETPTLIPEDPGMQAASKNKIDPDDDAVEIVTKKSKKEMPDIDTADSRALLNAIDDDDDQGDGDEDKIDPSTPPSTVGTASTIMYTSAQFAPMRKIKGVVCEVLTPNEIILTIENDDKPIARLIYVKRSEPTNVPTSTPFGWTIKLRDGGGRCSRILDQNLTGLKEIAKAVVALKMAVLVALDAEIGDFVSANENMTAVVNQYKST